MSKQLLNTHESSVAIVGLDDRAFAVIKDENNDDASAVLELVAANQYITNNGTKNDAADQEKMNEPSGKDEEKKSKKKQKHQIARDTSNPHEIQAVCCTKVGTRIWLAVSREDKSLSLYCIPVDQTNGEGGDGQQQSVKSEPTITYNLPKRARCLAFSTVTSASSSGSDCHVVIAGDLSGDAIAFPVPVSATASTPNEIADTTTTEGKSNLDTTRRLLLGHTASVLTGLNVVPTTTSWTKNSKQKQLILTADRDEKIRVSYFPETHVIHGYLLGHTSFISTMDAITDANQTSSHGGEGEGQRRALSITGSGDGTVRLWDYETCKEVGMVPVVIKKCADEEEDEEDDVKMPAEDQEDEATKDDEQGEDDEGNDEDFDEDFDDEEESFDNHAIAVPISVSLSPNADSVVVARDGVASIDIHPIPPPPSKESASSTMSLLLSHLVSLHKKQTVECPSQPLAVRCLSDGSVLVLAREPDYLLHYQSTNAADFKNISSTSAFSTALQKVVESQRIIMPTTTLESERGEWKLQKNKVQDPSGENAKIQGGGGGDGGKTGLHWNDAGRKETAKLAQQRRRKRRRGGKKEKQDAGGDN